MTPIFKLRFFQERYIYVVVVLICFFILPCCSFSQNKHPKAQELTEEYLINCIQQTFNYPNVSTINVPTTASLADLAGDLLPKLKNGNVIKLVPNDIMGYNIYPIREDIVIEKIQGSMRENYVFATAIRNFDRLIKVEVVSDYKVNVTFSVILSEVTPAGSALGIREAGTQQFTIEFTLDLLNGWRGKNGKNYSPEKVAYYKEALIPEIDKKEFGNSYYKLSGPSGFAYKLNFLDLKDQCENCDNYVYNELGEILHEKFSTDERFNASTLQEYNKEDDFLSSSLSFSLISVEFHSSKSGNSINNTVNIVVDYSVTEHSRGDNKIIRRVEFFGGVLFKSFTKIEALQNAISKFDKWLENYIYTYFPVKGSFKKIATRGKKNKINGIIVNPEQPFPKGYHNYFYVSTAKDLRDFDEKSVIGTCQFKKKTDEGILCTMREGEEKIIAMINEGHELTFISFCKL